LIRSLNFLRLIEVSILTVPFEKFYFTLNFCAFRDNQATMPSKKRREFLNENFLESSFRLVICPKSI
jgi:hypothetical protein